ncbi:hypothetical protein [Rhizobium sp. RU36D]|uniref:hypothetical protein n=1 Tax=Rhizobium sp. RU36D TaxID=1907415 RepID=UPI0009D8CF84|nr:hypothetical protein [Rhizobium sp. RU36D]SMC96384.1 hypothetical protein SAMN05880593_11252 [Rhizobium sp. RU36D]
MHGNSQDLIVLILVLAVYNLGIMVLLKYILAGVSLKEAALEKAPTTTSGVAETAGTSVENPETSYSRVTGLVGMIVMACFLWGLGNVIFYMMLIGKAGDLATVINSVGTYFLAGASLFAPYAVNQLRAAFK